MSMPWTAESRERAAAEGRYLVKVIVQGKHVDGSRFEVAGDMGAAQGRDLLRAVVRAFNVAAVPEEVPDATADRDVLHDLLSLVLRPTELPPRARLASWTPESLAAVEAWAAAEHLLASDNDVDRLPMPPILWPYVPPGAYPGRPEVTDGE